MALDMDALFNIGPVTVQPSDPADDLFGDLFDEPVKAEKAEIIETTAEADEPEVPAVEPEPVNEAETTAETAEKAEDVKAPVVAEKPKKAKKAAEPVVEEETVAFTHAKFEPQKVSVAALKKVFTTSFEDPQWETVKSDLQERTKNVKIEPELTYGACRVLLAQTTNLLSDLITVQSENKKFYDRLCDKVIGLIPRQEQLNAYGKNEADRKRNSVLSCEEFMVTGKDGKAYNLFDIAGVLFDRIAVIDGLIGDVKQKKETLVSFLAIFKLEASAK